MLMGPGSLIRAARQRHGLTQAQLARRAGTTASAVARLEGDRQSPSVDTLARLLAAMGEELEISSVRRPLPQDDGPELAAELRRPIAERLESALAFNDFVNETAGVLADR